MEWPLQLWQVLRDELTALREAKAAAPPPQDSLLYAVEDIDDFSLLAKQVVSRATEVKAVCMATDAQIGADIADDVEKLKTATFQGVNSEAEIRNAELHALNILLKVPKLHEAFVNVPLSRSVRDQERNQLSEEQHIRLNRDLLDCAFAGGVRPLSDKILPAVVRELHEAKLSALCFSGGGIRSATFCLGAAQGLASKGVLGKFDYLSTVSGGGFIGGWLAAWTHWSKDDLPSVISQLSTPTASKLEPEPDPIFYLRNFSNYLTPRTGLFSVDTWTLAATYARNLLLNWIVLLPLLIALLAVPRLVLVLLHPMPDYVGADWRETARLVCLALAMLGFACAMFYQGIARPSHLNYLEQRSSKSEWALRWLRRRRQTDFLLYCLIPLVMSAFVLAFYVFHAYLFRVHDYSKLNEILWLGGISAFLGWFAFATSLGLRVRNFWDLVSMVLSALAGVALFYYVAVICAWTHPYLMQSQELYLCVAPPLVLVIFLLAATIFVGLATFWTNDEDREYWARMGAWILIASFTWCALSLISLFGPKLFVWQTLWSKAFAYGGSFLVSAVTAYFGFSVRTPAHIDSEPAQSSALSLQRALPILGAVSIVLILAVLAMATSWLVQMMTGCWPQGIAAWHAASMAGAILAIIVAGFVGLVMSALVDPNKYSLHAMYRNRLIRAYLGASREKGARRPNPFTGFDPNDNIPMVELWRKRPGKLMPFINMSLNMVEPVSTKLAWQERKAESFTVTPLHSGSFWVGYRPSRDYALWNYVPFIGHAKKENPMPISLGTATAISGAAVSPNMGYNSSPIVAILLTLFNARLGWWLGNPGTAGSAAYMYSNPGNCAKYLLDEAMGRTNDQKPYVYLSDGGHFENLGLYEMVLRRCHTIVVIDADQDCAFTFENLGNAIRKIRTDMGISIDFEVFSNFQKRKEGCPLKGPILYCCVGKIHYSRMDGGATDGNLIYIKPTITSKEPADVLNYEKQHPEFPHETTADQWFSESQFESYRALGEFEINHILEPPEAGQLDPYQEARGILTAF